MRYQFNKNQKPKTMIDPKEKAAELVNKFVQYTPAEEGIEYPFAKQCALIAVKEIKEAIDWHEYKFPGFLYEEYNYWEQVEQEIQNF